MEKSVQIPTPSGQDLAATITYPAGRSRVPFVLLLHGWRGTQDSSRSVGIANKLCKNGIGSIRFDFRGHGKSDGEIERASVKTQLEDVQAVGQYLQNDKRVEESRLAVVGASIGGSTALLALSRLPAFCCGVLISTRSDFRDGLKLGTYSFTDKTGTRRVNRVMLRVGRSINFFKEAKKVDVPVLLMHGTDDASVPFRQSQHLSRVAGFKLKPIDGGDHVLKARTEEVVGEAVRFLVKHLL
jgi:dipeptidyl aminopeptidase/acylaminoacyl peptidase